MLWARIQLVCIPWEELSQPRRAGLSSSPLQALSAWGMEALLVSPTKTSFPRATDPVPLQFPVSRRWEGHWSPIPISPYHPLQHPWADLLDIIPLSCCLLQTPGWSSPNTNPPWEIMSDNAARNGLVLCKCSALVHNSVWIQCQWEPLTDRTGGFLVIKKL